MDWSEVQRRKRALITEVAGSLNEVDLNLLQWLVEEERRNRFLPKGTNKIPKLLRDQLDATVKETDE